MLKESGDFFKELCPYLPKSKVRVFEKFYDTLKSKGRKNVFQFCLQYTISKNETLKRITGEPNALHPLEVALMAIKNKLDFSSICGALLHDIVEDELEAKVKALKIKFRKEKSSKRHEFRKECFNNFKKDFYNAIEGINNGIKATVDEIIDIVDILTRYRTPNPDYYYYIRSSFGRLNKKHDRKVIEKALVVKYLDRINNIVTMDTKIKKILNNKIKSELRILDLIKSDSIRKKYKRTIHEQASLLIDLSFSEGRRLNQIWKNTYLLLRARMYFCFYKLFERNITTRKIEEELINKTMEVLANHKNDLKLYLKDSITNYWDRQAKFYEMKGGLRGKTKPYVGEITKDKGYLIFNNTMDKFSRLLLKDSDEYKRMQVDKEDQYKYLAVINELLKKLLNEKEYVCDLSKYVVLRD